MRILAVETCTEACSAALLVGDDCRERFQFAPRRHTELLLPMTDVLLDEAGLRPEQLDAVAFSRGPGAFTGVRIGAAVAQGIALGADLPLVPVSTLAALALRGSQAGETTHVCAALDARMGQVYVGLYSWESCGLAELVAERVSPPDEALGGPDREWVGLGSGWDIYCEALGGALPGRLKRFMEGEHPHAGDVATLGAARLATSGGISAEEAVPVYLRDRVVGP